MNKTSITSSLLSAHCMILLAIIVSFPVHTADDALISCQAAITLRTKTYVLDIMTQRSLILDYAVDSYKHHKKQEVTCKLYEYNH